MIVYNSQSFGKVEIFSLIGQLNTLSIVTVLLSVLLMTPGLCIDVYAADGPPPAPVVVAEAQQRQMSPTVWVAASVVSRNDARLAAEVEGRVEWIAEVGTQVQQGQDVARINDMQLSLQSEEYQAEVARNNARLKFLEQEVARLTRLAKENNAAVTQLEQTIADRDVAKGDLASAQARLKRVQDLMYRSVVQAPFAGVVVQRLLQPGEWADNGEQIVRLVDSQMLEIQAMIPLSSGSFLAVGDEVTLQKGATTIKGRVRSLVPVGDIQSRLLGLRIDFSEPSWPAGQTIRVAIPTSLSRSVVAVPRDALIVRRGSTAVYRVLADDTAEHIEVTTGIAEGEWIEVIGDIRAGDRVITRGGERLRPKQKVTLISPGGSLEKTGESD